LYSITEQNFNDAWEPIYQGGGLIDMRKAQVSAAAIGDRVYEGILQVHEALVIGTAADMFGDIPYSQALDPEIDEPALDPQLDVYAAVQSLLSDAIANLASGDSGGGAGPGTKDFNFGGDAASWLAVAHSLQARFHLHLVEVEGSSRYSQALAEAQQGVSDVSGNWTQIHSTSSTERNSWFNFEDQRAGDMRGNAFLIDRMNGGTPGDFTDDDPRASLYWALNGDGEIIGHQTGNLDASSDPLANASWLNVPGEQDFPQPIISCTETQFIIAEAQSALGNDAAARAAAKAALDCQEDYWGVDLTAQKAEFDGVSGQALFAEIMEEKFISVFLSPEGWNDWKRTCTPLRAPAPGASEIRGRYLYALQERQTNSNVPEVTNQPARNDNDPNACPLP
jgi:hypothetical protein